jgi:hypothetical protein
MLHSGRLELMEGSLNDVAAAVGLPVVGDWTATGSDATRSSLPTPRAPTAFEQSAELREQLGFGVGGFRAGQQLQQELVIAGLSDPELVMDPAADRALQVMGAGKRQHRPVPPVQAQRQQRQLPGHAAPDHHGGPCCSRREDPSCESRRSGRLSEPAASVDRVQPADLSSDQALVREPAELCRHSTIL